MADADTGEVFWYDPDPRAIIPLDDNFHIPRRLARTLRQNKFEIKMDTAFRQVMTACAAPTPNRPETWISDEFIENYVALHQMGFAHSVESWQNGQLVGGLYGVALQGLFAGESMFSLASDASKIALVYLVNHLRAKGFILLDTQFTTPHLARFGTVEIPADEYKIRLAEALTIFTRF